MKQRPNHKTKPHSISWQKRHIRPQSIREAFEQKQKAHTIASIPTSAALPFSSDWNTSELQVYTLKTLGALTEITQEMAFVCRLTTT